MHFSPPVDIYLGSPAAPHGSTTHAPTVRPPGGPSSWSCSHQRALTLMCGCLAKQYFPQNASPRISSKIVDFSIVIETIRPAFQLNAARS